MMNFHVNYQLNEVEKCRSNQGHAVSSIEVRDHCSNANQTGKILAVSHVLSFRIGRLATKVFGGRIFAAGHIMNCKCGVI